MSELSSHDLEPTGVPEPVTAGFPAAQPAAAPQKLQPAAAVLADELPNEPSTGPDRAPRLAGRGQPGKRLVADPALERSPLTPQQRLLILDSWVRSGLPAGDFAPLVGISKHTLYSWKYKFETEGPVGLEDKPRGGPSGSRLSVVTKRAILMMKQDNPEWGCERISTLLLRGPALLVLTPKKMSSLPLHRKPEWKVMNHIRQTGLQE